MSLLPFIQAGAGLLQSIFGGIKARKFQKQLSRMQSPTYDPNQSIMDYYNQALQRYNVAPTESALYKRSMRDVDRGFSNALSGLQDRRAGIAGASSLLRAANDARLNAEVAAENEKSNRFGVLGSATGMKAGEEEKAFQRNKMLPFQMKYNLLSQRAGAANQLANAGLSNLFGGLQSAGQMKMLEKMYGKGGGGDTGSWAGSSGGDGYDTSSLPLKFTGQGGNQWFKKNKGLTSGLWQIK